MNKPVILSILASLAAMPAAWAIEPQSVSTRPHAPKAPVEHYQISSKKARLSRQAAEGVAFTVDLPQALKDLWIENFDAIPTGWEFDPTTNAKWSIKQYAAEGSANSFSAIDPADVSSLVVEGDYRAYNREITNATSPALDVPPHGSLCAWVGYTLNYDDMCRLIISVSDDDFETSTEVWNSKDDPSGRPWAWRAVKADLSQWAGKKVKVRFTYTYGSADETFKTGGYMGDFAIDGLRICAPAAIDHIDLNAGDSVRFINISATEGNPIWEFPGGDPEESFDASPVVKYTKDGTFAVTIDVNGETTTIPGFVTVTGGKPTAHIQAPAMFKRYDSNRSYMVAPLVPVKYVDASEGYPTSRAWGFMGTTPDEPYALEESTDECPVVEYAFLHDHFTSLDVKNEHGQSSDIVSVTAEYSGLITNLDVDATATNFDMDDWGIFPGNLTKKSGITAFAEHFSAPSRPMRVGGCYVYFTKATAEELYDQIADIGVHLYTSENGKPGKKLDSMWWRVVDLDLYGTDGTVVGTDFPFTDAPFVDGDFFIVIDGFHEFSDSHCVAFAMSPLSDKGGSAWILHNEQWKPVTEYFAEGKNHTSFFVAPYVDHSVLASLPVGNDKIEVSANGGKAEHSYFTYLAIDTITTDDSWIEITSPKPELTVATLEIMCQPLPAGVTERTGHVQISDGASVLNLEVVQNTTTGIAAVTAKTALTATCASGELTLTFPEGTQAITIVDMAGRIMATIRPRPASTTATISTAGWPTSTYAAYTPAATAKFHN